MTNAHPSIGLLPLYLQLYDTAMPKLRAGFEPLLNQIVRAFTDGGVRVVRADICRVEQEFKDAVRLYDKEHVDLIVTVHLAYSPSLEAIDALVSASAPILMLDTTMDSSFGPDVAPERLMYNHGVHGVQDLASMLLRRGKTFRIVAGHITQSDVLQRAVDAARAAYAARRLRSTKALRIGDSFKGMGDFAVPDDVMRTSLGITVEQRRVALLATEVERVSDTDIEQEILRDREAFQVDVSDDIHRRSVRVGLALRHALHVGQHTAFSLNFLAINASTGPVDTVPFLEASKAMARGLGYAGEGDVLTASLVGAINSAFGKTTFTEIFCPDWQRNALFISHMGEVNPAVAAAKPLLCEKDFPWTGAKNPAVLTCSPAVGPAVLVNIAPGPNNAFRIIAAPMDVLDDATDPAWRSTIRGWIRPRCPLPYFLEQYSRLGGTHHKALLLGERTEAIEAFATYAGLPCDVIQ